MNLQCQSDANCYYSGHQNEKSTRDVQAKAQDEIIGQCIAWIFSIDSCCLTSLKKHASKFSQATIINTTGSGTSMMSEAANDPTTSAVSGTCHCGAITITVDRKPYTPINECQCSICYRYGAAWAYYKSSEVHITKQPGKETRQHVWANKTIAFHFCETCGCCVYWWPTDKFPEGYDQVGVNTKMMDLEAVRGLDRKVTFSYEGVEGC